MPAVTGIDPQDVVVDVHVRAVTVVLERGAAVLGAIERDPQYIEIALVARIDADLAEVHRARVEAVHASPRLACIGGTEHAARLERAATLFGVHVLDLSPETRAERCFAARVRRARGELDLRAHLLLLADVLQDDLVPGLVLAQHTRERVAREDDLVVEEQDDVLLLQVGRLRGAALRDAAHPSSDLGILCGQAEITRVVGESCDPFGLDDREDHAGVLLVPVDPDPTELHLRETARDLAPGLAAIRRLLDSAARTPLLLGIVES